MNGKRFRELLKKNALFWLSRQVNYPLHAPDVVQVNFTFDCNLACKMCSMHSQKKALASQGRRTDIPSPVIRKVIKEAKEIGAQAVLFIGGEPLLRQDLFELVAYCRQLRLGAVIVTNGVLLTRPNLEKCFASGVDWMSVSIDAATEDTFAAIRGERVLARIQENLRLLQEMKRERKSEFPHLVAVCTIMDRNLEELDGVVRMCRGLGIERVLFQPVVMDNTDQTARTASGFGNVPAHRLEVLDAAVDRLLAYKRVSRSNFDFIANSPRFLSLIKKYFRGKLKPAEFPCYAGFNRLQVVQEGKLYFCVNQHQQDATFGDVEKETLKDMWYSSRAQQFRSAIRKCKVPCLQWCAYRDDFGELAGEFHKLFIRHG